MNSRQQRPESQDFDNPEKDVSSGAQPEALPYTPNPPLTAHLDQSSVRTARLGLVVTVVGVRLRGQYRFGLKLESRPLDLT